MTYRDRTSLNRALLIIIVSLVVVVTTIVLVTNAIISNWGRNEIFTGIGVALILIGGIGVYTTYAGGVRVSDIYANAQAPEMARAEAEYAFKRRRKIPWVGTSLLILGGIFLALGLIGIS
ncbi:MAG: hypothetical protein FK730_04795 [Asgard group archaeon]|nr:hypothetical protein [Asgard group archaeon]